MLVIDFCVSLVFLDFFEAPDCWHPDFSLISFNFFEAHIFLVRPLTGIDSVGIGTNDNPLHICLRTVSARNNFVDHEHFPWFSAHLHTGAFQQSKYHEYPSQQSSAHLHPHVHGFRRSGHVLQFSAYARRCRRDIGMHDEMCRNVGEGISICTQLNLMFSVSFCMQEQRTGVLETETGESPNCIERKGKVC